MDTAYTFSFSITATVFQMIIAALMTAVIASFILYLTNLSRKPSKKPIKYKKVRVHRILDGDTVIVKTKWRKLIIRLDAIDCPEGDQYWGDNAKYGLIKLIGGRNILLEIHDKDRYKRIVATVYVDQQDENGLLNVNNKMVMLGHAWVYRQYYNHLPSYRRQELDRIEKWARKNNIGMWQHNPIPPWTWRRQNKNYK